MNSTTYNAQGELVRSETLDIATGKITIWEDGETFVIDAPQDLLAQVHAETMTVEKKAYAERTVPQLRTAAERLLASAAIIRDIDPSDPASIVTVTESLHYSMLVLGAVCAGLSDLVNTIDKDIAFRRFTPEDLINE